MSHHSLGTSQKILGKICHNQSWGYVPPSWAGTRRLQWVSFTRDHPNTTHTRSVQVLSVPPSLYTHLHPCQFTYNGRCNELDIQESLGMVESAAITISIAYRFRLNVYPWGCSDQPGLARCINAHVKEQIQPMHTLGKNMDEMDGFAIW